MSRHYILRLNKLYYVFLTIEGITYVYPRTFTKRPTDIRTRLDSVLTRRGFNKQQYLQWNPETAKSLLTARPLTTGMVFASMYLHPCTPAGCELSYSFHDQRGKSSWNMQDMIIVNAATQKQ